MKSKDLIISNIFKKFDKLDSSFIDASSIIYLKDIKLLELLSENIELFTIKEIIDETGFVNLPIKIYEHNITSGLANDRKLIESSIKRKIPIITEDKKLLNSAKKSGIDYYNALMMLNFLFYLDKINFNQYDNYYNRLVNYAWYSSYVIEYGNFIFNAILKIKKKK